MLEHRVQKTIDKTRKAVSLEIKHNTYLKSSRQKRDFFMKNQIIFE